MTVFDFADALTPFIESLMFFMLFEAFLKRRDLIPVWSYGAGGLVLATLIALSNHYLLFAFSNIIFITGAAFLVSRCLYRGSWQHLIMITVLGSMIVGVSEIVVLYVIVSVFSITVDQAVKIAEYRFLGVVVAKIIGLAICYAIRIKSWNKKYYEHNSYWMLFIVLFTGPLIAVFLIFKLTYEVDNAAYNKMAVFSAFALLFGAIFALYLYERLERQRVILCDRDQYAQHLKGQIKYLDEMLIKQKEWRSFRHDISNQLLSLKGYFSAGDYRGGVQHIHSLLRFVEGMAPAVDTGNIALDAILSTKQAIAEHKGITFDAHIRIGEKMTIDSVDLSVIFGNALDNAIEACDRLNTGEKRIVLELCQQENTLICQLANTAPAPQRATLKTSKSDKENHGYGFANLTASIQKYGGEPMVTWEDGWFTLSFVLFMPEETEHKENISQDAVF